MIHRSAGRWLVGSVVAMAGVMAGPTVALADPAGPTDYRSEVTWIDPPTSTISARIVGGDAFVELTVEAGTQVTVIGYAGEPYLLFDLGGQIFENRRSPATYYNRERYGADIPTEADPAAPPHWRRVGSGGTWAWHDHRAHRMEQYPPVNADRGDQVLDSVIPLVVSGDEVDVHVASTWMPPPSRAPVIVGLAIGTALTGGSLAVGRYRRRAGRGEGHVAMATALGAVAAVATAVGALQFRSLPASTDPLVLWWLAPLLALAFAVSAAWIALRSKDLRVQQLAGPACTAIAGAQLVVWGFDRRHGLVRAVLPTDVPYWFDRVVTAAALAAGVVGVLGSLIALVTAPRLARRRSLA